MRINHEYVEQLIIATERHIEGKSHVEVETVKLLLHSLKELNNVYIERLYFYNEYDDNQTYITFD